MKKNILLLLVIFLVGCSSFQVVSTPPEKYEPSRPTDDKELITEWQQALIKIKEWQAWAEINKLLGYEVNKK